MPDFATEDLHPQLINRLKAAEGQGLSEAQKMSNIVQLSNCLWPKLDGLCEPEQPGLAPLRKAKREVVYISLPRTIQPIFLLGQMQQGEPKKVNPTGGPGPAGRSPRPSLEASATDVVLRSNPNLVTWWAGNNN